MACGLASITLVTWMSGWAATRLVVAVPWTSLDQNGCQVLISGGLPGHSLLGCQKENGSDSHFAKCLDTCALWHMVAHGHFP